MKFIELVEGQSHISSIFCWNLMQLNNDDYRKIMDDVMSRKDEEVPGEQLKAINALPYP